jgi:hypothetical protein
LTWRVFFIDVDVANIFISYRRDDSGGHAGRLCDRLTARFGDARVFMDLQDIGPGQNFASSIDETIASCDCVIAVIGPRWVDALQQRAAAAEDFVQHEIAAALRRDITVIPVLVGGARMPAPRQLPPAIAELSHRNAIEVRDERFDDDVARLCDAIAALGLSGGPARSGHDRQSRHWRRAAVAAAVVLAVAAGAAYLLIEPRDSAQPVAPVAAVPLDGEWIAEMQKEGQPPFRIRLTFVTTGDSITGMVGYPTGEAAMLDARRVGDVLTFYTSHVPQFESTPAVIRFQSEIDADEIRLTAIDDYGIAKGVARRQGVSP